MIRRLAFILALLGLVGPAHAALTENQLSAARTTPRPGAHLPPGLHFRDQAGRTVRLGQEVGGVPIVLLFADYTCTNLCGPGLTLVAGALHDSGLRPGRDYRLLVIGIDPKDGPEQARAMRDARLAGLPAIRARIVMLSGSADAIRAATDAFGYRYVYDPATDQFAHDAVTFVLAPDGGLSSVLPETAILPGQLRAAIRDAADGGPERGFIARVVAQCYGFGAAHGLYGAAIRDGLRAGAALIVLALGAGILLLARRRAAR
jgi:protein SCO1/2